MTRSYPRLLVVTEFPPNAPGGGPAVVRQMLKDWPAERLFWWSCLPDVSTEFGQQTAQHFVASIPSHLYPHVSYCRVKASLLLYFWTPWAARHLKQSVGACHAEVIWFVAHQWSLPPAATALAASAIPYHISIHDFPDAHHTSDRLGSATANNWVGSAEKLYASAATRDAISEEMARSLRASTREAADQIVHAGVEEDEFAFLRNKVTPSNRVIQLAYAGTIIAEATFALLIQSLDRIRSSLSRLLELELFSAHSYRDRSWFDPGWMIERGNLPLAELQVALSSCDWALAPMELTDDNPRYNRFSLPTKVVSYLGAGVPMICIGHSESTVIRLASRFDLGLRITENELDRLDEVLLSELSDADPWTKRKPEFLRAVDSEFNASTTREGLYARLGAGHVAR